MVSENEKEEDEVFTSSLLGTAVLRKVANTRSTTKTVGGVSNRQIPLVPVHFQSGSVEEIPFYL